MQETSGPRAAWRALSSLPSAIHLFLSEEGCLLVPLFPALNQYRHTASAQSWTRRNLVANQSPAGSLPEMQVPRLRPRPAGPGLCLEVPAPGAPPWHAALCRGKSGVSQGPSSEQLPSVRAEVPWTRPSTPSSTISTISGP